MPVLEPTRLATALVACARLQLQPPESLLAAFYSATGGVPAHPATGGAPAQAGTAAIGTATSAQSSSEAGETAGETAGPAAAAATPVSQPSPAAPARAETHAGTPAAAPAAGRWPVSTHAKVLWSLASLGAQPEAGWLNGRLADLETRLASCNGHELSNVLFALSRMERRPSQVIIKKLSFEMVWHALQRHVHVFVSFRAATVAVSAVRRGCWTPEAVAAPFNLFTCVLCRRHPPPDNATQAFLQKALDASLEQMHRLEPQSLANIIWALATMNVMPDEVRRWFECVLFPLHC